MKSKPNLQDLRDILSENRAQALAYANQVGTGNVRELLKLAEADLLKRIDRLGVTGTFTEAHLRTMLSQVRLVTQQLVDGISTTLADESGTVAEMAANGTIEYMTQADELFRGVGQQPLALREASVLDSAKMGAKASMLRRIALAGTADDPTADPTAHPAQLGVMQRYGLNTIGEFEKILRVGVLTRKDITEVAGDLTEASPFLRGKPAFWAERIARTEMMGAYNRASWESQREINDQVGGDMVKILSATFDTRTAADSYAVHGQIRRPDEAFETWYGFMQHPPARPNDREVVVPHRIAWPIPKYLAWKTEDEIAARWKYDGRKDEMPERPLMTTVDLGEFGKEPEKEEESAAPEEVEPGPAIRDVIAKGQMAEAIGDDMMQDVGFAPGEAPDLGTDFDEAQQLADQQAAEEALKAKAAELLGSFPDDPTRPGRVLHGMPFANSMFWEGWTSAEQDLISSLSDELIEKDATKEVDTDEVIMKGPSINKQGVAYGIEDNMKPGMAMTPVLIQKDGLLYAYSAPADVVGKKALGIEKLDAHVVNLDDPDIAKKFPSLLGPPPPKVLTADEIMATKTGAQKGSNTGGFYKGADGVERYVKEYSDPAQAHCENIANAIYRKLGLEAPDSMTFEKGGKTLYAHATVKGDTYASTSDTVTRKDAAKEILKGFAADVFLGNRDVIGMSKDNILLTDTGVRRLDNGGSLLMRAQAGRKPVSDLHQLREWDGFFNGSVNTYASVLDEAGVKTHADMKKQLVKGIKDILKLRDDEGGFYKLVDKLAPTMADKDRRDVAEMLETRATLLEEKLKILNKRVVKPKPKPIALEPGKWGPTATTTFEELLKQPKKPEPANSPTRTPNGKSVAQYLDDARRAVSNLNGNQRQAIRTFTGSEYGRIRSAGRMTREEYERSGGYDYDRYRAMAEHVETGFDAVPEDQRVQGIVYRGMLVPRAVANTMLAQNDRPHLPGLGAMFSTARDTSPAKGFLNNGTGDTHVFMVIKQRRGVAIETISGIDTEHEVLMSGRTRCRLTDHYIVEDMDGNRNVLVLHLEEVLDDADLTGTAKPKRTRKKKEPPTP